MTIANIKTRIGVGIGRLFARLPRFVILGTGRLLGRLGWWLPNKRKKIAARNISLCFPDMPTNQQRALLKKNLISTGQGFAETLMAYWSPSQSFMPDVHFYGREHLQAGFAQGKGCILLSCHLHSMELIIRAINQTMPAQGHMLARQHNNKVFEAYIDAARRQHCHKTIDKKDLRTVLKSLKANQAVYYVPDQNFSYQCQFVDFFKQPAATVMAPVKLAQSSRAAVIPWFGFYRNKAWHVHFLPAMVFDKQQEMAVNLRRMNRLFEQQIIQQPDQSLWVHRRFKNHPHGINHVYKDL